METAVKNPEPEIYWPSAVQFGLSALAIVGLLGIGFMLALTGLAQYFAGEVEGGMSLLLMSAGLILSGLLLIPSAGYALLHLLDPHKQVKTWKSRLPTGLVILLLPLVLWLGNSIQDIPAIAPFLLPLLHVAAIGIPVLWVLHFAIRGLSVGSAQRTWGIFGTGLVLAPLLILIVESFALIGLALLVIGVISFQPDLARDLQELADRFSLFRGNPEEIVRLLAPFLARPAVIYTALAFIAGIVPLIEEALKPLGVFFLVGVSLSPAAGFVAGALSGAGFALFESLALSANGGEEWAIQAFVRSGAAIIHIANTSLMGYALALAWQEKSYIRLGVAYLLAVTLHGLWNGLSVLNMVSTTLSGVETTPPLSPLVDRIGISAPFAIAFLALVGFTFLLLGNRLLRRTGNEIESQ